MKNKLISTAISLAMFCSVCVNAFAGMYTENPDTSDWIKWQNPDFSQRAGSVTDASFLLDAPAGKHGFVSANGEDIYFEDGAQARFWGINVGRESVCPSFYQAEEMVNRIAQSGYNLVRFHQYDSSETFDLLFGGMDNEQINKEQLNKMFYFMSKLKEKGIYFYVDLLNKRNLERALNESNGKVGAAKFFDSELIALQKEYANELLTTVNPYTGLSLADDPAMVFMQLVNEDGIFDIGANSMSEYYINEMHELFNSWLLKKYSNTDALKAAWGDSFTDGESLESKTVTFFGDGTKSLSSVMSDFGDVKKVDVYGFLYSLTENYYITMRDYLHSIGVKCMITGVGMGGPDSNEVKATVRINKEHMDFTDAHTYMSHPYNGYDMLSGIRASTTSMLYTPEMFKALPDRKPYNQPFVLSEWNDCNINEYRAEGLPMMAGYACFQNYIPIQFSLISGNVESNNRNSYNQSAFGVYNDPIQTAVAPMASMIYLRHEVDEAKDEYYKPTDKDTIIENQTKFYDYDDYFKYGKKGIIFSDLPDYDASKTDSNILKKYQDKGGTLDSKINDQMIYSTHDETESYKDENAKDFHVFSINSQYTNMTVGFQKGAENKKDFGDCTISYNNDFALVGITSVTNEPLAQSSRILMTAVGRAHSTGYDYTLNKTSLTITNSGEAPMLAEPIDAEVVLKTNSDVKVYALNSDGRRMTEVATERVDNGVKICIDGSYNALSYEIIKPDNAEDFISAYFNQEENQPKFSGVVNDGGSVNITVKKADSSAILWSTTAECDSVGNFSAAPQTGMNWENGNYTAEVSKNEVKLCTTDFTCFDNDGANISAQCDYLVNERAITVTGAVCRGSDPVENANVSVFIGKPEFEKTNFSDIQVSDIKESAYEILSVKTDNLGKFNVSVEMFGAESGIYKVFVRADIKSFAEVETVDTEALLVDYQSPIQPEYDEDDGITTVLCIGDNLTVGRDDGSTYEYSYPNQLSELLENANVENYGKSETTLCVDMYGYKGTPEYNASMKATDPEYIVIMLGTNDFDKFKTEEGCADFKAEYLDLIDMYRDRYRDAKFILISPPPLNTENGDNIENDSSYDTVAAPLIEEVATQTGSDFVNGYQFVKDSKEFAENGFGIYYDSTHFTPDGYGIFAKKLHDIIKSDQTTVRVDADYTSEESISLISDSPVAGASIYVAAYNSDGRLDTVSTFDMTNIEAYKSYVKNVNSGFQKAFIWSNDGNIIPIANVAEIGSRFVQNGTRVTVSGKTFAGKTMPHAICVKDSNGNVVYAGQVDVAPDSSYVHTFNMPDGAVAGEYTVLSSSYGNAISETFSYIK